ncbi:YceI family protein [Sporosarcina ureae]|uniref:YceI family protein n=1 Tax=Sporosarcina ureae TaxID=1571 RepID=UPI0026E96E37|nr:YceI family protein [Sporosarcina ureae]
MNRWKVDRIASTVGFSVPHMMVSTVTGTFEEFSGELQGNIADLTKSKINFQVIVPSIQTKNRDRDLHLCSKDFFDAQIFPQMTFTSRSIYNDTDGKYQMSGDLTVKNTTKRAVFYITPKEVTIFGATYLVEGEIKRKDFGLMWNRAIEAGGVMVGDVIDIQMTIVVSKDEENIKQQQPE